MDVKKSGFKSVSIPERDSGKFRDPKFIEIAESEKVSIPERDSGKFRDKMPYHAIS